MKQRAHVLNSRDQLHLVTHTTALLKKLPLYKKTNTKVAGEPRCQHGGGVGVTGGGQGVQVMAKGQL